MSGFIEIPEKTKIEEIVYGALLRDISPIDTFIFKLRFLFCVRLND